MWPFEGRKKGEKKEGREKGKKKEGREKGERGEKEEKGETGTGKAGQRGNERGAETDTRAANCIHTLRKFPLPPHHGNSRVTAPRPPYVRIYILKNCPNLAQLPVGL